MSRKEIERDFTENLEKYLSTGDIDARDDFMYAANILVMKKWYKPASVRDLYKQITGKQI